MGRKYRDMKIGDTLYISIQRDDCKTSKYRCKLVDIFKDRIYIDYPISDETNKTVFLPKDLTFYVSYQNNQNVFKFSSYLIERKLTSIPTLVLYLPPVEEHIRIQRRKHVRVEAVVDLAVHCSEDTFPPFTTTTRDISGGGVSIIIKDRSFTKDILLNLSLVLKTEENNYDYIFTQARFIRYKQLNNGVAIASLQFINLDGEDQQRIISFCFKKEREQRKQESFLEKK